MKTILTKTEESVIFYLAQGLTNAEISPKLNISKHTVKSHLESIYYKFQVKNRVQAVIKALDLGLFSVNDVIQ